MIFLRINLANLVQFKQYQGKSGPRSLAVRYCIIVPPCPNIILGNGVPQKEYLGERRSPSTTPLIFLRQRNVTSGEHHYDVVIDVHYQCVLRLSVAVITLPPPATRPHILVTR